MDSGQSLHDTLLVLTNQFDLYFLDPQWLCDILATVVTIREINPFAESLNQEITTRQADIQVFNQELVVLKEKHAQLSDKVKNGTNKEEEKLKAQKIIDEKKKFIEDYLKKNNQFQQEFDLIQGQ